MLDARDDEVREATRGLRPIDDEVFYLMARDCGFVEEVLRTVTGRDGLEVERSTPQWEVRNAAGHGVVLDAAVLLADGTRADVEVQCGRGNDDARRVRYHSSMCTISETPKHAHMRYDDVPDVWVVYITEYDAFGRGEGVYRVCKTLGPGGPPYADGSEEFFVNGSARDGSDAAALMELFTDAGAFDDERFPHTSAAKRMVQDTVGRNGGMNPKVKELVDKYSALNYAEGIKDGRAEGRTEGRALALDALVSAGRLDEAEAAGMLGVELAEYRSIVADARLREDAPAA